MGTWQQGVPYTDGTADQVTTQVAEDVDDVLQEDANRFADLEVGTAPPTAGDTIRLISVTPLGVVEQRDWRDMMLYSWGGASEQHLTGAATIAPGITSVSVDVAATAQMKVSHLPTDGSISWAPIRFLQSGAGQLTFAADTLALILTTGGVGTLKTRAQWSVVWALPITDFSGTTVWTMTGDLSYIINQSPSLPVIPGATTVTTGDGKFYWRVPAALNGLSLVGAYCAVVTTSSSGLPTVQLARGRQAAANSAHSFADMLSTRMTIDVGEYDSRNAATAAVVNTSNATLATGDLIRVDVDVAGTGTAGLIVTLEIA